MNDEGRNWFGALKRAVMPSSQWAEIFRMLGQLEARVDNLIKERDNLKAEVERLKKELAAIEQPKRDPLEA